MGKSSPKPPPAPDPAKMAAAQGQANLDAAIASGLLSNIDRVTPFGSVRFNQTGTQMVGDREVPLYEAVTSYDPQTEGILRRQQGLTSTLTDAAINQSQFLPKEQFSLEGLPFAPGTQDFAEQRGQVEKATFDRALNLLQPQLQDRERALEDSIAQRGLPTTGENATILRDREAMRRNKALEDLALSAVLAGGGEQNRLFGLQQATRQQGINERLTERTQPFNELAAFLQGSPALQGPPQANPVGVGVNPADYIGAQGLAMQQANNIYNQESQNQRANMGGLFNLGGAAITAGLFSDERLKTDIVQITKTELPLYSYRYYWSDTPEIGVMAQDVLKVAPEAVSLCNGFMTVDYERLFA